MEADYYVASVVAKHLYELFDKVEELVTELGKAVSILCRAKDDFRCGVEETLAFATFLDEQYLSDLEA